MTFHQPPRLAERIIEWATAWPDRLDVLGDLAEEFDGRAREFGLHVARRWYWRQTARAIAGLCRRRGTNMRDPLQDVTFAFRSLKRQPAITVGALASLVLGAGLCLFVFGLYDAVALKPLPVEHAGNVVAFVEQRGADSNRGFSYLDYTGFRAGAGAFKDIVAFSPIRATMTGPDGAALLAGELVSASYFEGLGVPMRSGRGLTGADHDAGAPVIVISESLLRTRFSGGPAPAALTINNHVLTVVGVARAPFAGLDNGRETEFWTPLAEYRRLGVSSEDLLSPAGPNWLRFFGVLATGVSTEQAARDLNAVESRLARTANRPGTRDLRLKPAAHGDSIALSALISPLQLLLGGSVLVLMVALGNVAGLMVARSQDRTAELSIRLSLGASRYQLLRLMSFEAVILVVGALAASLPIALSLGRAALPLLSSSGAALPLTVTINSRILWLGLGLGALAVLTILGPGVARLLTFRRVAAGSQRAVVASRGRLRQVIVATQFAISFGLLVVAVLLTRSLINLRSMPAGIDIDRVALVSVDLSQTGLSQSRLREYYDSALQRLSLQPGVRAAGIASVLPLAGTGLRTGVFVQGYQPKAGESMEVNYNSASASYFAAMGIALLRGRLFDRADRTASPVALVNEAMADRYWGLDRAVGQHFRVGDGTDVTVLGVVRDAKYRNLREERGPSFYLSTDQVAPVRATLHVSVEGDPIDLMETLRQVIARESPGLLVTRLRTLRQQADLSLTDERVATTVGTVTGGASVLLASIGLFATFAYGVIRRRRELGLRLALGASPASVRFMILREAIVLISISSPVGAGLGLVLGRYLQTRLYGVETFDPVNLLLPSVILTVAAIAASWLPAHRASIIDPALTLRAD
jgi:putative ABC transport system permease protein